MLVAVSLAGCVVIPLPCKKADKSRVPLEQNQLPPDSEERLREGDRVITYTKKGQTDEYEVVRLEDSGFIGTAWDHKQYRVRFKNVDRMWITRYKWGVCPIVLGP